MIPYTESEDRFLTYYVPQSHPGRKLRDSKNLCSFYEKQEPKRGFKYKHAASIVFHRKKLSQGVLVHRKL